MIVSTWNGGTDYGGCIGAGNGWNNSVIDHHFATSTYQPEIWFNSNLIGVFQPNISTAFRDIKDGTSNTIMTGELQRLDGSVMQRTSQDGWALGGVATLFDTAMTENGGTYQTGGMNNDFFESPAATTRAAPISAWRTAPSISSARTSANRCSITWGP